MTNSDSKLPDDFSSDTEISDNSGHLRVVVEIAVAALILVGIYFLFAPDDQITLAPPLKESQIDPIIRAQIDSANQPESPSSNTVASPTEPESVAITNPASEESTNERVLKEGEAARTLITRLRSRESTLSPEEVLKRAASFQQQGSLTDAYLLLFYAAKEGDGPAAFALAAMHDPNHFTEGNSLLETPDAYQAHKWYTAALKKGITTAKKRLQVLRSTTEKQAMSGDLAAQRLLLNWQ